MNSKNTIIDRFRAKGEEYMHPRGSKESIDWFRETVRKGRSITDIQRVQEGYTRAKMKPGTLVTYSYNPKYEKSLEFYDNFPLVILTEVNRTGWYGINLHYLSPKMRGDLMIDLEYGRKSMNRIAEDITNNPMSTHGLKRYLPNFVSSKIVEIPKNDWDIAIQLPYEAFVKESRKKVWSKANGRKR